MRYLLAALALVILLTGCAMTKPQSTGQHDYTVAVVDRSGNPINGVSLSGNSLDRVYRNEKLNRIECKTSKEGTCHFPVKATADYYINDLNYTKRLIAGNNNYYHGNDLKWGFATAISLNAEQLEYFYLPDNSYFGSFDVERVDYGSMPAVSVPNILVIKLVPLKELLCKQNFASPKDMEAAHRNIENTVNIVREQAIIKDFQLESFRVSSFKNKDYISSSINFPIVFNSEKSSRYENVGSVSV